MKIFRYIGMAFIYQIFLFIVSMGLFSIFERFLPSSTSQGCSLTIYCPFYSLVVNAGNLKGESTMIEAPIFALVLGSITYSLIFGFLYYFYKISKNKS